TDFEEFAVYDTRIKPHKDDKASTARIFYCKYDEYLDKFDFLIDTFSKEAILRGSFDRYVQSKKNKRGTSEVDDEILALVEEWRLTLAKNIAKQNPSLDSHLLNVAVQRIVDRILFLRIAEDRRIEEYEALLAVARKSDIYSGLQRLFGFADEKYNAGLFKHEAWLEKIRIDDKVLKPIIAGLYYPESPYEFSVLPIEILGSIYERFLGKTIVLSPSHVAKVEEKPEVRKAGGVYYTPQYIVDYIIAETVGEKFDANRSVTVLDPACGSGSFLVGAYTFLLNSHLAFYTNEKNLKKSLKSGLIYESRQETYLLSIEEKQRILLASIFGVDIDPIAVEVTKLSLYLKLLENETDESAGLLLRHSTLKMLPNLDANIRCGNSLIGSDFYRDKEMPLFGDNEIRRINAFDWHKEFPAIFKSGGFDCVIGNPPYVRQETLDNATKEYFQTHYSVYHGAADLYAYFIEKGIGLLKPNGKYGIIVANKWLRANYGEPLRKWLKKWNLLEIVDFGDLPVFGKVTAYPLVFRVEKAVASGNKLIASQVQSLDFAKLAEHIEDKRQLIDTATLDDSGWQLRDEREKKLFDKLIAVGVSLKEYVGGKVYYGIKTGLNEAFVIDAATRKRLIKEDKRSEEIIKPFLAGRDIKRYAPLETEKFLILFPKGFTNEHGNKPRSGWNWLCENYSAIANHLEPFKKRGQVRQDQGDYWWELRACDYYGSFEQPKIVFPDIALRMQATYDVGDMYSVNTSYIIPQDDKYLLALLNSAIVQFVFVNITSQIRGGYSRFLRQYVERLPIYRIDENSKRDRAHRDKLVSLVEQMLSAQEKLLAAISDTDRKTHTQRIEILDQQIDAIVYELYELTDEEIRIVEGVEL
ncbi:MAG: Eco57I restriction-modification methylase domain-containing protein, partial [Thermoguttaceae bacterium]